MIDNNESQWNGSLKKLNGLILAKQITSIYSQSLVYCEIFIVICLQLIEMNNIGYLVHRFDKFGSINIIISRLERMN